MKLCVGVLLVLDQEATPFTRSLGSFGENVPFGKRGDGVTAWCTKTWLRDEEWLMRLANSSFNILTNCDLKWSEGCFSKDLVLFWGVHCRGRTSLGPSNPQNSACFVWWNRSPGGLCQIHEKDRVQVWKSWFGRCTSAILAGWFVQTCYNFLGGKPDLKTKSVRQHGLCVAVGCGCDRWWWENCTCHHGWPGRSWTAASQIQIRHVGLHSWPGL